MICVREWFGCENCLYRARFEGLVFLVFFWIDLGYKYTSFFRSLFCFHVQAISKWDWLSSFLFKGKNEFSSGLSLKLACPVCSKQILHCLQHCFPSLGTFSFSVYPTVGSILSFFFFFWGGCFSTRVFLYLAFTYLVAKEGSHVIPSPPGLKGSRRSSSDAGPGGHSWWPLFPRRVFYPHRAPLRRGLRHFAALPSVGCQVQYAQGSPDNPTL